MYQPTPSGPSGEKAASDFFDFVKQLGTKSTEAFFGNFAPGLRSIVNTIGEIDADATKVAKSFGQGRENIGGIKMALVDAATSVEALGGKFGDVAKIQTDLTSSLGRAVMLTSESYDDIFATQQVTGIESKRLFDNFKNIGVSAYGVAEGMQKIVDTARQQGLSVAAVSEQAVSNMDALNKYNFQGGVDGLAKMAAQATSLRIDMSKTLTFAENLYKPEKAIEMSAALQRLGVTQTELLDPLRLMDLSINDPGELQNQLVQMTQQFVTMGEAGNFEIAPEGKLRMRELASEMGMTYEDLTKMALGSAELENKLSKIRFPEFMTEEQQKMVANLSEMKDGQYVISIDGTEQNLQELLARTDSAEELNKILDAAKPKTMEELAKEQLNLTESMEANIAKMAGRTSRALATSKIGQEVTEAFRGGFEGLTDIVTDRDVMSSKSIRDLLNIADPEKVGSMMKDVLSGKEVDFQSEFAEMGKEGKGLLNEQMTGLAQNLAEQGKKLDESNNLFAGVASTLIDEISGYIKEVTGVDLKAKIASYQDETALKSKTTTEPVTQTINNNSTVDVTIKVEAPPGMSTQELTNALNTTEIQQKIIEIAVKGMPDYKTKPQ